MIWTCPLCKRTFKHKNQWHSCVRVIANQHLENKNPNVNKIYEKLMAEVEAFGSVTVSPVQSSIMVKAGSTFLSLKPKKEWMDIEFLLDEEITAFPVHKTFRVSKHRVAHYVRLEHPKEINRQLLGWLKRAYKLISGA